MITNSTYGDLKNNQLGDLCYSVAQLCLTLQPHELQHTKLPCPSPTPRACSNSCPSRTAISSSVVPFSSSLQSLPASGSFPMSQYFASGGQSIGASASTSVLPINIQDWFLFSSVAQSCLTLWDPMNRSMPGLPVHHQLLELPKLISIESVMPINHLILCHPLLLLLSFFPSIRVFSNESSLHIRWPKYWSFSFSISPSNEYSGLISFRID